MAQYRDNRKKQGELLRLTSASMFHLASMLAVSLPANPASNHAEYNDWFRTESSSTCQAYAGLGPDSMFNTCQSYG